MIPSETGHVPQMFVLLLPHSLLLLLLLFLLLYLQVSVLFLLLFVLHLLLFLLMLPLLLQSRCHLAFVTPDFLAYGEAWRDGRPPPPDANLLGIVTMEDVIEQLIQSEIMDEFDGRKVRVRGLLLVFVVSVISLMLLIFTLMLKLLELLNRNGLLIL